MYGHATEGIVSALPLLCIVAVAPIGVEDSKALMPWPRMADNSINKADVAARSMVLGAAEGRTDTAASTHILGAPCKSTQSTPACLKTFQAARPDRCSFVVFSQQCLLYVPLHYKKAAISVLLPTVILL